MREKRKKRENREKKGKRESFFFCFDMFCSILLCSVLSRCVSFRFLLSWFVSLLFFFCCVVFAQLLFFSQFGFIYGFFSFCSDPVFVFFLVSYRF